MDIKLWEGEIPFFNADAENPNCMKSFFIDTDKLLPCVVVLPGGGYRNRARHEAEPIAEFFNSQGFHAVVVEYRVFPNRFPSGLSDVQRAIRIVRYNAEKWGIDPQRIVVCGFSAGGHLAASSLLYPEVYPSQGDAIDKMPHLPNGAILCYPVISLISDLSNASSGINLLGEERYDEEKFLHSAERLVNDKTSPVFMFHTSDDNAVNVKNSLTFATALRDHGIPFELHVFPRGKHGVGLANEYLDLGKWKFLAAEWIKKNIK